MAFLDFLKEVGPKRNATHMGVSFLFVFMAFSVSQNFQTSSDHKKQGANALGILYGCFTFFNFACSFVVQKLGPKVCLFGGACTYALFVAANIHYVEGILYASSALIGIGASILWTAQGAYISNCAALHEQAHGLPATSTLGYFNGLFFSLFQVNQLVGNLLAALLFKADVSQRTIFIIMTTICAFGCFTLLFLSNSAKALTSEQRANGVLAQQQQQQPSSPQDLYSPNNGSNGVLPVSSEQYASAEDVLHVKPRGGGSEVFRQVVDSLKMLLEPRMMILAPIMVFSGWSQGYFFGDFPPLLEDKATKFFMLAVVGATNAFMSALMGRLSDRVGRVAVLLVGFVCAGSGILFLMHWHVDQDAVYVFFLVGIVFGVADAVFNTQIYALVGSWFEGRVEHAFAIFKFFQAGSTAVAFLLSNKLGFFWKSVLCVSALASGFVMLFGFDLYCRFVRGRKGSVLDGGKQQQQQQEGDDALKQPLARDSVNIDAIRDYEAPPMM